MILIINTTGKNCMVGLHVDGKYYRSFWNWNKDTGSEVLEKIGSVLSKAKKKITDLEGIVVDRGPGSYTGVRVGVTIANTFGYALNVPVVGFKKGQLDRALKELATNSQMKKNFFRYFPTPVYK